MARALTWLDVFTDRPLTGNALAVVHDADGVSEATMLAFAGETRLSETTFVQSASEDGADYRNRIWMTTGELPFAGHPSLGTAVAVAHVRGDREAHYVQQTGAGLQSIDVALAESVARASMLQEPAQFGAEHDPARVLPALGLDPGDAHPELPPQVVSTGLAHLMIPLGGIDALARARPDAEALRTLVEEAAAVVAYLAVVDVDAGRAQARGFFIDHRGCSEDPATGSAAGPLAAYVHARAGTAELEIAQGVEMGRASRIEARLEGDRVRVGGDVVIVATGDVRL